MNAKFGIIPLVLSIHSLFAQSSDTPARVDPRSFPLESNSSLETRSRQFPRNGNQGDNRLIKIKGNLIFYTSSLPLSSIEEDISNLEEQECTALLKRDTVTLQSLWQRDFTLDYPKNNLIEHGNSLPHYLSYIRTVERFSVLDNFVYTSGYETVQLMKLDSKPIKRVYFHTWKKIGLRWKLIAKSNTNE